MRNRIVQPRRSVGLLLIVAATTLISPGATLAKDLLITRHFPQTAFSAISVHFPAEVDIRIGNRQSVTITAEPAVIGAINLSVRNDTLALNAGNFQSSRPIKVLIETKLLNALTVLSSGTVNVHAVVGERFTLRSDSSADIALLNINIDHCKVDVEGSENIKLSGKTKKLEVVSKGSSEVDASNLPAQSVVVKVSGASSVNVNSIQELRAIASESASIKYLAKGRISKQANDAAEITGLN